MDVLLFLLGILLVEFAELYGSSAFSFLRNLTVEFCEKIWNTFTFILNQTHHQKLCGCH